MRKARGPFSYANVAATIALVAAIGGGTAVALDGKNTVDSGDIKKGQVRASDLGAIKTRVSDLVSVPGGTAANGQVNTEAAVASCKAKERFISGSHFWAGVAFADDRELFTQSESRVNGENGTGGWLVVGASDEADAFELRSIVYCLRK